jgi:hypothetical protein
VVRSSMSFGESDVRPATLYPSENQCMTAFKTAA